MIIITKQVLARPAPPPLPVERSQWHAPFACVGVDHTGHFYVRQEDGEKLKVYICLFVCTVTRAVYLETVTSLTATSFLLCLRRLAATHGAIPRTLVQSNVVRSRLIILINEEINEANGPDKIVGKKIK